MAQLEITEKDIATVERLHDKLCGKGDMSAELQVLSRELIARMYEAVQKEKEINDLRNKLLEDVKRVFPEMTEEEKEAFEKKWLEFLKKPY